MQNQMNLADLPVSATNTNLYKTPLKTFQKYFDNLKTPDFKEYLNCLTEEARKEELEGETPTDAELSSRSAQAGQDGFSQVTLESFIFTANVYKPKIKVLISSLKNQVKKTEEITLTMIDTADGWKIDEEEVESK